MSHMVSQLEDTLGKAYKQLPNLPATWQKALVRWAPWLSLIVGLLSLWAAYEIWHWVHLTTQIYNDVNAWSALYGYGPRVVTNHWSFMLWLSVLVLIAEAVIYLLAFPALQATKKAGWDLLFYGALANVAYGVVVLFTSYGDLGQLVWSVIGAAIGLYFLYQIRSYYTGREPSRPRSRAKHAG